MGATLSTAGNFQTHIGKKSRNALETLSEQILEVLASVRLEVLLTSKHFRNCAPPPQDGLNPIFIRSGLCIDQPELVVKFAAVLRALPTLRMKSWRDIHCKLHVAKRHLWNNMLQDKQEPSLGPLSGTNWDPSLGQTGLSLFNSTVKSPFCPVCPWDGWGFVPGTIVPHRLSEKCLCVFCLLFFSLPSDRSGRTDRKPHDRMAVWIVFVIFVIPGVLVKATGLQTTGLANHRFRNTNSFPQWKLWKFAVTR